MFWNAVFVACLAIGTLAEYEVTEQKKELLRALLQEQCTKNGAQDKAAEVESASKAFVDCVKSLFDAETIRQEIEDAKPNGSLDEVFGKHCQKAPQLKACIGSLLAALAPCLDATARDQLAPAHNASAQLIDFVCYKDGDRIALFIADGGPECFTEKSDGIRQCAEKLKNSVSSVDDAKKLSVAERCGKFDEVSRCVVAALESCATPTPANMAESLFKYVRKSSPCHTALPRND